MHNLACPATTRILGPLVALILLGPAHGEAQQWKQIQDLRGPWKFELGDNSAWSAPEFNDREWTEMFVPSAWEDEGFPGYDGYAWYRKRFTAPGLQPGTMISLQLGNVDDVCEVFLNGTLIGSTGSFPPHFRTAYDVQATFLVPEEMFRPGRENVLAVRIYDEHLSGGIMRGKIGLFERTDMIRVDAPLPSKWKFTTGDDPDWKDPGFDDSRWQNILVPSAWDILNLAEYDGFGWYRVRFTVPEALRSRQLILLLGRIDDLDETWLNGERIGRTGRIRAGGRGSSVDNEYLELRAYTIPPGALKQGENVLAVRVYDAMFTGGIYDGPIGIVTRERYQGWKGKPKPPKQEKRWWEVFEW